MSSSIFVRMSRAFMAILMNEIAKAGMMIWLSPPVPNGGKILNFTEKTLISMSASQKFGVLTPKNDMNLTI